MATEPVKGRLESPTKAIQTAIRRRMYHPEDPSKTFICEQRLLEVWSDHHHVIHTIFLSTKYSDEDRKTIWNHFLRILSILILIGWSADDLRSKFRSDFLRVEGRTDNNLPFTEDQLSFLDNWEVVFGEKQFAFIPAIIEESDYSHIQRIERNIRLPFSEKPVQVGDGAYGHVSKVTLPPRCLRHITKPIDNYKSRIVACKTYPNENSAETFRKEVANLDILKEGLRGSPRVMQHIAAIVHGNDFMILLPIAELYDLEIFLRGGRKPEADTRESRELYSFSEKFPQLATDSILHSALLRELFEIASALVWLHEELHIFGSLDRYLAHQDLKPENILLTRDSHSDAGESQLPAGKWMLTDFGVSLFNKDTNTKATKAQSIRDVGPRLTSMANRDQITRGHGPYEPPEVDLRRVDGRMCDVWSFGCILCDVLAFACGREEALHDFRDKVRFDNKNDYFYRAKGNSVDRAKVINDSNTELKSEIKDWFTELADKPTQDWIPGYVAVIEEVLVPNPVDRPKMRNIMKALESLPHKINNKINRNTNLVPDGTRAVHQAIPLPTSPAASSSTPISSAPIVIRPPTPELKEANNQDSSSIETLDLQSANAPSLHARSELNLPPPTSRTVAPTEGPRVSASAYEHLPKITIHLPKKEHVIAVELTPGGEQVAYLCGHRVHAYKTDDGSKAGMLELQSNVKWTKFRVACNFLAVYGLESRQKKRVELHDFNNANYLVKLPITCHREEASNVLLSSRGHAACIYGQYACLWYLTDGHQQELSAEKGFVIKGAAFSANGNVLCFWTSGAAADHAYFFDVGSMPAVLSGTSIYEKTPLASRNFTLWPYSSLAACVVRESHGSTSVVQLFSQAQSKLKIRQAIGTPRALVGCVAQDDVLICIEKRMMPGSKRDMSEYELSWQNGSCNVSQTNLKLGTVENTVDDRTNIAARVADGKLIVTLCTLKGHILKCTRVC